MTFMSMHCSVCLYTYVPCSIGQWFVSQQTSGLDQRHKVVKLGIGHAFTNTIRVAYTGGTV